MIISKYLGSYGNTPHNVAQVAAWELVDNLRAANINGKWAIELSTGASGFAEEYTLHIRVPFWQLYSAWKIIRSFDASPAIDWNNIQPEDEDEL